MEDKTHGGNRSKSGRKPVPDKKVTLSIYPLTSEVEALGIDKAKEVALNAVKKEARKILKK